MERSVPDASGIRVIKAPRFVPAWNSARVTRTSPGRDVALASEALRRYGPADVLPAMVVAMFSVVWAMGAPSDGKRRPRLPPLIGAWDDIELRICDDIEPLERRGR
jgi:hypothetical protein